MTIEFFTGFEGCGSSNDMRALLDDVYNSSYPEFSETGGYDNGKCCRTRAATTGYFTKNTTAAKTKVVGLHINNCGTYNYSTSLHYHLLRFTAGSDFIRVFNTSSGLKVYKNSTMIASCATIVSSSITHIEVKLFSDATVGTVQIKVNQSLVLDESGLDTGGSDITNVLFSGAFSVAKIDNVFIADDWQGELISELIVPTSDLVSGFTPLSGTNNYEMVDEVGSDGDTTYVESNTVGQQDMYGFEDVPTSGYDVIAVSIVTVAKKTSGTRSIKHVANQDSTDYDQEEFALALTYPANVLEGQISILNLCPDSTAWTPAKLNAIYFGFEVSV